ncbi:MAG: ABC transporter substrate-binding protein [Porphyrobacter sp.]|nr:ABC transporter substrate-binding protein [Porphyrobacter sp.]
MMNAIRVLLGGLILALAAPLSAQPTPGPIAIHGNMQTFEIAPVLYAADAFYPGVATVKMGGIPNLVGEPIVPGFGEDGVADVATHAETQALRYSVRHPDLRIILNVSEGLYRIVARRSAGIASVADLKGKRVATIAQTSSGYFLHRMLAKEGLSFDDIVAVPISPLSAMTEALRKGEVDAVVIWEPESENSAQVLGADLIEFHGDGVYRELFNLNTTAANLADPAKRAKIVRFVRSVIDATAAMNASPDKAKRLVVEAGGFSADDVEDSWKHHRFNANFPPDLLDVLVLEEQWLARRDNRPARGREELAKLIDMSVFQEALALGAGQ